MLDGYVFCEEKEKSLLTWIPWGWVKNADIWKILLVAKLSLGEINCSA